MSKAKAQFDISHPMDAIKINRPLICESLPQKLKRLESEIVETINGLLDCGYSQKQIKAMSGARYSQFYRVEIKRVGKK